MSWTKAVAITGCDSGLGWAIAARSAREGLLTFAGMFQGMDTDASLALKNLCAHPYPLDVTKTDSVIGFRDYVQAVMKDHPNCELYAVVNNAGVMTIGDYEWQTPKIIENTINVNLLGAMRVVSAFLPELRKTATNRSINPRIINVASHCGLQPLPGFGPYSASKAGLLAWTRSLRLEQRQHGLPALAFIPGGFVNSSNLLSYQISQGEDMVEHLSEEQRVLYEKKIKTLCNYLGSAANGTKFDSMNDENIMETFFRALNDENPKELYKVESWRYMFYYNLLKLPVPETMHQWLIKKFISFPQIE
ncbi:D-beta-hydroxybutyrate dehydrogenase, mitochondrial [Papilio xuthus]|uniref:D-beta-hydroxybutyrate dehydrogenase, mitochondrial n=1 Tax=Papilio xuthus TaxID=66420 RepID=A0A194PHU2_PAPXU|nr:D-beta-hydroxybutyrate dehydrogenase, mitochondrial [Papilio xuthus]